MTRSVLFGLALGLMTGSRLVAGEISLNGHKFTLPDGFEIELVATSPLVDRPITADFDELGRLYVADSSGSNDPVQKQLEERTHRIVRLQDTDGDGKFDKSVVYADKMMFPEGTLWYDGSLYVAAPPSIWKLTDTDGDGVADRREEWFAGKTLTGCANDLHGPYLGPDGWIYWCKGAFAEQTYEQPGRKPLVTKAAHIFRRRADGTGPIENVMTGGMDNPVDVVFTPGGERLFTTTFLQNPGGGLRDGMIHAVYGGVYGKVHNVTDFYPRTGDLLPPLVHMGAAAPCGLARAESAAFGEDYLDSVYACQFNMHKVSRHALKPAGATFQSVDSDFVVSDNIDFHPTDVQEDADGSLIVCDTGGWYKLCCPTSQLSKPDVLGGVYRVRRTGQSRVADPRGTKVAWSQLAATDLVPLLDDPRPAVRQRAIHGLGLQGKEAVTALKPLLRRLENGKLLGDDQVVDPAIAAQPRKSSERARMNAIWALARINSAAARAVVRESLFDHSRTVRQVALQTVSLWRDHEAMPQVLHLLRTCTPQNQRLAAEVLGRLGDKSAVPDLLAAPGLTQRTAGDRVLEHGITFALIEIADPQGTAAGLESPLPAVQRSALIALDQMPGGSVDPNRVVALLGATDPMLKETALWLTGRHPEWSDALEVHLRRELKGVKTDDGNEELVTLLAKFAGAVRIQELLATAIGDSSPSPAARMVGLTAMQKSGLKQLPESWITPLSTILSNADEITKARAIAVVRSLPLPKTGTEHLGVALRQLAMEQQSPAERRVEAIAAFPTSAAPLENPLFSLLLSNLGEQASVSTRSAAVESLTKSRLTVEQLAELANIIPSVGPLELNRLLGAFETATDEAVGRKLIAGLKKSPVLTSLRVDMVKLRIAKFPPTVHQDAEELYSAINVEAGRQRQKLDELTTTLGEGDVRRGQLVFQNSKAACSACHAIGYLGGTIGPDLSRIGKIRTERDILEALLFPSVSFVRSYEPVLIVTKSGKSFNGLIRRETADEITLATGAKEEARIPREEIEEIRPGTVSIMPAGLDTQLTREQLTDLVAFLKSRQ
ncbi:MAG: HEAT repeat domain-containing protein [Planctomycetes bacterium]|nr:HEAT repeat domain-containing protein [Planctomycetota bacterium]